MTTRTRDRPYRVIVSFVARETHSVNTIVEKRKDPHILVYCHESDIVVKCIFPYPSDFEGFDNKKTDLIDKQTCLKLDNFD